jgi:tetratricopeptide (TPR) repeat protein
MGRERILFGAIGRILLGAILLLTIPYMFPSEAPSAPARAPSSGPIAEIEYLIRASRGDSALGVIARELPAARARGDSAGVLFLLAARGQLWAISGRAADSESVLRDAIRLAESMRDSVRLSFALRWLGVSIDAQGRRPEAREIYARLIGVARARSDRISEAWATYGIGWIEEQEGHGDKALRAYNTALGIFRENHHAEGEIWALNGLGSALHKGGRIREAAGAYETSMRRAREAGNQFSELRTLNNLGTIEFSSGDPARAMGYFQRACSLQTAHGNIRESMIPALNVAICRTHLGQYKNAEEGLRAALDIATAQGWRDIDSKLRSQLATVVIQEGSIAEGARLFRECLASANSLPIKNRIEIAVGLSNALADLDSSAAGLAVLDRMARDEGLSYGGDSWVELHGARGLRLLETGRPGEALENLLAVDRRAADLGLNGYRVHVLAHAARAYRRLGAMDSSLALLERACGVWESERRGSTAPEWREQRGRSGRMIYTDLAHGLMERDAGIADAFDRLQMFKTRTLLERMSGPDAWTNEREDDRRPFDLLAFRGSILKPNEVFLDYYLGPEISLVFGVTVDEIRCAWLPSEAKLIERIRLYRQILSSTASGEDARNDPASRKAARALIHRTSAAIDSIFCGPLESMMLGKKRILISPDGPLHSIPLGLSWITGEGSEGKPMSRPDGAAPPPLWVRVPSAAVLARIRSDSSRAPGSRAARIIALAGNGDRMTGSLDGAEKEVRHLRDTYRGVATRLPHDGEKNGGDVFAGIEGFDLVHMATHARIQDQTPWESEIVLGNGAVPEDSAEDSYGAHNSIRAREIAAHHMDASLVVLSSCESAGGGLYSGEGVAGLTSAVLATGVPAVVASLWPVDDGATAYFMDRFYGSMAGGSSIGTALRQAQTAIRENPLTSDPLYWAGFVLIGDDRPPIRMLVRAGPIRLVRGILPGTLPGFLVAVGGTALVLFFLMTFVIRGASVRQKR